MDMADRDDSTPSGDRSCEPGDWNEVLRVGHDINNFLGAIAGFAEMLVEEAPRGSHMESDLRRVLDASRSASALVEELSDYARLSQRPSDDTL
jgi:signal transduction histidine kinase